MKNIIICFLLGLVGLGACAQKNYKNVDAAAFKESFSQDENAILLDVRTPAEWKDGVVESAKLLNFYSDAFDQDLAKLNKEKTVYVYCRSGGRSAKAAQKLIDLGFTNVYNLNGGIGAWNKANYPTVKP